MIATPTTCRTITIAGVPHPSRGLFVMAIALGGCIKAPPVAFGITEDTGGHITYVLGAAMALARRADIERIEIVTRLIDDARLGPAYAVPIEPVAAKLAIRRLDTGDRRYLAKEANAADRPAFTAALLRHLGAMERRPDVIHAHFADAGEVALAVRERFGIPVIYTAHSLAIDKQRCGDRCASVPDHLAKRIAEEDRIIGAADAIVASSRDEAERQLMLYPGADASRIHRIAPGAALASLGDADPARARALVTPFLRDPDKPILLAIARPVAKKNLAGLVDLYAADPELRAAANLVILAGLRDGPDSGEAEQREVIGALIDRLDRLDLYGSLALPKRHDQADVASLYALARASRGIFVNPALTEPYGLTLTEAALAGVPVVATCHGGAADIVASLGHGRCADPADPTAFAAAIRGLLADPAAWRAASWAGRRNGAALNWDAYATRLTTLARSIAPRQRIAATIAPKRLLLCDIDHTLTGCRDGARAFRRYIASERDLAFGVATGRSLQEAWRLLEEWGQPAPRVLITSVGSEIYWHDAGRTRADDGYREHIDAGWDRDEVARRLATLRVEAQPPVEQRRHKLSYFLSDPARLAAVRGALADLPVRVVHSHGNLLDILPGRAGKGAAMAWVARRLRIAPANVFAAGDSGNDLDMLAACRNAILVANHSSELAPLLAAPTTYRSRLPHAGGVLEGMRALAGRASGRRAPASERNAA